MQVRGFVPQDRHGSHKPAAKATVLRPGRTNAVTICAETDGEALASEFVVGECITPPLVVAHLVFFPSLGFALCVVRVCARPLAVSCAECKPP